jgi:DNA-binding protein HU-beta
MNKSEFVSFIASRNDCTQTEANNIINVFTSSVQEALKSGESVNLVGFGAYAVVKRPSRQGRNPKTGAPMTINAYSQPTFKAGKGLKDACN